MYNVATCSFRLLLISGQTNIFPFATSVRETLDKTNNMLHYKLILRKVCVHNNIFCMTKMASDCIMIIQSDAILSCHLCHAKDTVLINKRSLHSMQRLQYLLVIMRQTSTYPHKSNNIGRPPVNVTTRNPNMLGANTNKLVSPC